MPIAGIVAVMVLWAGLFYWMWVQMKLNKLTGERLEKLEKRR